MIHQFGQRVKGKLATQVQRNKFTAVQMTSDYRGDTYTVSLTVGNPDIINGSGTVLSYYHFLCLIFKNFLQNRVFYLKSFE